MGSTYINDVFVETHAERNRIDREHGIAMSGRAINEELLTEVRENYGGYDWNTDGYQWTTEYNREIRKYEDIAICHASGRAFEKQYWCHGSGGGITSLSIY